MTTNEAEYLFGETGCLKKMLLFMGKNEGQLQNNKPWSHRQQPTGYTNPTTMARQPGARRKGNKQANLLTTTRSFAPHYGQVLSVLAPHRFRRMLSTLLATMLLCCPPTLFAAPTNNTGTGWQTTLDQNDGTMTYSFDYVGGLAFYDQFTDTDSITTPMGTAFEGTLPTWETLLSNALSDWGTYANITFVQVEDSGSEFGAAGAEGHFRFFAHEITEKILAYSHFPMKTGTTEASLGDSTFGDIFFNTAWDWTDTEGTDWAETDLFSSTAVHELGHSLGLPHNMNPNSIMYPIALSIIPLVATDYDLLGIQALYIAVNAPAEVFAGQTVQGERDWFALADGIESDHKELTISGHVNTFDNQKTGVKGVGATFSTENYAFDYTDLTLTEEGRITTRGHYAYALAVGDNNTITVNGNIETGGMSSDGIAVVGGRNTITTGTQSSIITHGESASGVYLGGDDYAAQNTASLNGQILTEGAGSVGVFIMSDQTEMQLSGSITTSGDFAHGICSLHPYEITLETAPTSDIQTSGDNAKGLYVEGTANLVTTQGTINTSGEYASAIGICDYGYWTVLKNTGTLTTAGEYSHGIHVTEGTVGITHYGTIDVSGNNSHGVLTAGSSKTVSVSGSITSAKGNAVRFGNGSDNTLMLHGSPTINGDIRNGGDDNGAHLLFGQTMDGTLSGDMELTLEERDVPNSYIVLNDNINGNLWKGDVMAGTTILNGEVSNFSAFTVHSGALLGGATTYTGNVLNNGTISPGNGIGTISIGGDYTQTGSLIMEADSTTADLLEITGSVTFADTATLTVMPLGPLSGTYTFITEGGTLSGSPQLTNADTLFLDYELLTDASAISLADSERERFGPSGLWLSVARTAGYTDMATPEFRSLASALDTLNTRSTSLTSELAQALALLDSSSTAEQANSVYSSLSPLEYGALPQVSFALTRTATAYQHSHLVQNRNAMRRAGSPRAETGSAGANIDQAMAHAITPEPEDPVRTSADAVGNSGETETKIATASAAVTVNKATAPVRVHAGALYTSGHKTGQGSLPGYNWESYGIGMGLERVFFTSSFAGPPVTGEEFTGAPSNNGHKANAFLPEELLSGTLFGFGASLMHTDIDSSRDSGGQDFSAALTSVFIGPYGSLFHGAWYLDAMAGYAYHQNDATRTVTLEGFGGVSGVSGSQKADMDTHQLYASLEAGYNHALSPTTLFTPFAGLDYLYAAREAFSENGRLGVTMREEYDTSSRLTLGTRLATAWRLWGGETPEGTHTVEVIGNEQAPFSAQSGPGTLAATMQIAWAHELAELHHSQRGEFAAVSDAPFTVPGYRTAPDSVLAGISLQLTATKGTDLTLTSTGEWASHMESYGLQFFLNHRF